MRYGLPYLLNFFGVVGYRTPLRHKVRRPLLGGTIT